MYKSFDMGAFEHPSMFSAGGCRDRIHQQGPTCSISSFNGVTLFPLLSALQWSSELGKSQGFLKLYLMIKKIKHLAGHKSVGCLYKCYICPAGLQIILTETRSEHTAHFPGRISRHLPKHILQHVHKQNVYRKKSFRWWLCTARI